MESLNSILFFYEMKFPGRLPPLLLTVGLLTVYGLTLAPGLTWAHRGADGGDLIAAAATGGVPHPTGYPTYLLLARLFQFLPVGTLAFRTNLLSALAAALAAALVYGLVKRASQNTLAAVLSGLAFGLSPLLWSQAVITEVYALHAFFVALILYLSLREPGPDPALGLSFGLAMGNHVTSIFLLPLVFAAPNRSSLLRRLAWTGAGLLTYLALPLRALTNPPVNWGNPVTLKNFLWLATGQLYRDELLALTRSALAARLQSAAALLRDQFGLAGLALSLLGLIFYFRRSRLHRNTIWIAAVFFVFATVYSTDDSYLYLLPLVLSFAVWLGLGVDGLMDALSGPRKEPLPPRNKKMAWAFGLLALAYLLALAASHFPRMDASRDARAEQFGQMVMAQMPDNAIVFAKGDEAVFALWYFHYAVKERPDLAVIAKDLLAFDWYRQTLKETYPSLDVGGPYPFPETVAAENPGRPACFVEYLERAWIRCDP